MFYEQELWSCRLINFTLFSWPFLCMLKLLNLLIHIPMWMFLFSRKTQLNGVLGVINWSLPNKLCASTARKDASVVEMLENAVMLQVLRFHEVPSVIFNFVIVDTISMDCLLNEWLSILVQWLYSNALLSIEFLIIWWHCNIVWWHQTKSWPLTTKIFVAI